MFGEPKMFNRKKTLENEYSREFFSNIRQNRVEPFMV